MREMGRAGSRGADEPPKGVFFVLCFDFSFVVG